MKIWNKVKKNKQGAKYFLIIERIMLIIFKVRIKLMIKMVKIIFMKEMTI